jgi:hypothetical protein
VRRLGGGAVGLLDQMRQGGSSVVGKGGSGVLGELREVHALCGRGDHDPSQARARLAHLERHQSPATVPDPGGELG